MAEVTNELMYEPPTPIHRRMVRLESVLGEIGRELASICRSIGGVQNDCHGIVPCLELAEPQRHQVAQ